MYFSQISENFPKVHCRHERIDIPIIKTVLPLNEPVRGDT